MQKVTVGIKDYAKAKKELDSLKGKHETAVKRIISDARERVPGWVANEVTKVYNIDKAEVKGQTGKAGRSAGTTQVKGDTIETLAIEYKGRLLTPVHFGMKPTAPPEGRSGYTLKARILKGQSKTLGHVKKLTKKQQKNIGRNFTRQGTRNSPQSPWMLQHGNGGVILPFQRRQQPGKMDHVMRTISMPQMVSSDRTKDAIEKAIAEGMQKRIEHHLKNL